MVTPETMVQGIGSNAKGQADHGKFKLPVLDKIHAYQGQTGKQ